MVFLLLYLLLVSSTPKVEKPIKEENKIKISLKEVPIKHKESGIDNKQVKQSPIPPEMPKGKQLEKIIKKPNIKYEPKEKSDPIKETKLNTKPKEKVEVKEVEKPKIKPLPPKNKHIKLQKTEDKLYELLSQDKSAEQKVKKKKKSSYENSVNQNIKELYGEEFGNLSVGQQEYILDNQEIMRRITQQVLSRVARVNLPLDLNVNRSNVIEFYLHPNGDMTDFKFLQQSGYYILDDTTKETIEYAYSRYPRPSEKTLIRYNVFYHLARY